MRTRRYKIEGADAVYHCMSRTVNGERLFGPAEREAFRRLLWRAADFSGVEILTYCVMSNHFHVLVRVPHVEARVSDDELLRRFRVLYPKAGPHTPFTLEELESRLRNGGESAESARRQLHARMHDVSEFLKTLKLRFSVRFNRDNGRFGPLWSERFKSVLVESSPEALRTVAAYIDLNPVRAGLVEDPKDYRFCGYAEAVVGRPAALRGFAIIGPGPYFGENPTVDEVLQSYRILLFGKGTAPPASGDGQTIPLGKFQKVVDAQQGELGASELLRCRLRWLTDGAILGSAAFIQSHVRNWKRTRRLKRTPRPRPVPAQASTGMAVIKPVRRERNVRETSST